MNISELIQSTALVHGYDARNTFTNKKFGGILLYNKTVRTKPRSSIVEVTMMIRGVTDMIKPVKEPSSRSVAAHKVMVSIGGVEQQTMTTEQLIQAARLTIPKYKSTEEYTDSEVLEGLLAPDAKPFEGKTIMPQENGSFTLITDKISKDSAVRVWCSCSSYYWVFQYYNVEKKVDIWGKSPERYIPKTKTGWESYKRNRPMRNPGRHPGMCKHIMLLLALLMDSEVISEARGLTRQYRANLDRFQKEERLSKEQYEKLIKNYKSDHTRKLAQRKMYKGSYGYASSTSTGSVHKGWSKKLNWDPKRGHWRKS